MKILVCLKQVPDTAEIKLSSNYTLQRDFVAQVMNPAEEGALEAGLRLRDEHGGSVTALSMGPRRAESMLREALSRGADHAVLLSDPAFAGADTLVTAKCLQAAAMQLGGFDVILCGRRAVDGETAQVGPMVAALLDVPCVANATQASGDGESLTVCQLTESGQRTWKTPLPALVTFCEWSYRLRLPMLPGLKRAAKAEVAILTPADIGLSAADCGLEASPARVVHVNPRPVGVRPRQKLDVRMDLSRLTEGGMLIAVFCEKDLSPALDRVGKGRAIAPAATLWALYESEESCVPELPASGADEALFLDGCGDDCAQGTRIANALTIPTPDVVLFPATLRGRFLSAWVAARPDTGLTADCTELSINAQGLLWQTRPAFGGNLTADILCRERGPRWPASGPACLPNPLPGHARAMPGRAAGC